MIDKNETREPLEVMREISEKLWELDYRITGLPAVNLYGYGIATNVFDIAVKSDEAVYEAVRLLKLPNPCEKFPGYDPYIFEGENFYIKIQGDIMGEPFIHPLGFKLHSKELLVRRLEIYGKYEPRALKACAWIALTVDDEKTEKYKEYWNRL